MKKNTPSIERILRILVGLILACASLILLAAPYSYAIAAIGAFVALTGLVGFCPICYVAGRKSSE